MSSRFVKVRDTFRDRPCVLDDKRLYYQATNLPLNLYLRPLEQSQRVQEGLEYRRAGDSPVVNPGIGMRGYYAGSQVHIVDTLALSDALLARLPSLSNPARRIGHMWRYVPDGYLDTIRTGRNMIKDPALAEYYDHLATVIKGPLWTGERWREIIAINRGDYDGLIDRDYYRDEVQPQYDFDTFGPTP